MMKCEHDDVYLACDISGLDTSGMCSHSKVRSSQLPVKVTANEGAMLSQPRTSLVQGFRPPRRRYGMGEQKICDSQATRTELMPLHPPPPTRLRTDTRTCNTSHRDFA
jgi:hypothetical protein